MKTLIAALSIVVIGVFSAHADPIKDREALMKTFGKSLGQLGPVAKGEKPFDAAEVQSALATLNDNAKKFDVDVLFPAGSTNDETEASPKIWENFADFKSKAETFKADVAAAAAAPATDVKGLQGQLGMIGKSCGGCHETYRLKKS